MKTVLFALPSNERLAEQFLAKENYEKGVFTLRHFPDDETYVRVESDVRNKNIVVLCTLDRPDTKVLPLYFLTRTLKSLEAGKIILVAPYLSYMRQDTQFHPGECVTSEHFASLLSSFADGLITVDPHLHRRHSLREIYTIPALLIHAAGCISSWIREHVKNPVLVGPDAESGQWVSDVARNAGAPFTVLAKERIGDRDVRISIPDVEQYRTTHTPVLVDDIISTARTMIETVGHLKKAGMKPPVCVGVHAVFAKGAYNALLQSGAGVIATCNTIPHSSNAIDVGDLLINASARMLCS